MQRWVRRYLWVLLAVVVVAVAAVLNFRGRPERAPVGLVASLRTDAWIAEVHGKARAGYWLAVRGTHPSDQLVAAMTAAELTHVALYDAERDEVIEAVGRGVLRTPLRELLAHARRLQIIRPRGYTDEAGRAAVAHAATRVGSSYDFLGTVGLPQERTYYCSELAIEAWRGRERGLVEGVLHPERMHELGEVVFDSGMQRDDDVAIAIAAELRARFARLAADARGVDYAAEVAPAILRGGVPDEQGIAWLRARGVKTVVSLRHYHGEREGEAVRAAGMRYEQIRLESTDAPEPEQIARFLEIVTDPAAQPVYVHCLHGVDRTGTMIAIYRMEIEGWPASDALAEMEHFGAHGLLHDLRRSVGAYTPTGRWRRAEAAAAMAIPAGNAQGAARTDP